MTRTESLGRVFTGALLALGFALAVFGVAAGVSQMNVDAVADGHVQFAEFDPQPEPPGRPGHLNPGNRVGFDPQPDPPGSIRGFNPQPEPPTKGIAGGR